MAIIEVRGLRKAYGTGRRRRTVRDGVDFVPSEAGGISEPQFK